MLHIVPYSAPYQQRVATMILHIQQEEFNVPVTIEDQPDLLHIDTAYQQRCGNFWIALDDDNVVGTIGLIDIGNNQGCLRKMFVKEGYRGKEKGTGQLLLDTLVQWCRENNIDEIYLGTINRMAAALKFYARNGFTHIDKNNLPPAFPLMLVDNIFLQLDLKNSATHDNY